MAIASLADLYTLGHIHIYMLSKTVATLRLCSYVQVTWLLVSYTAAACIWTQ